MLHSRTSITSLLPFLHLALTWLWSSRSTRRRRRSWTTVEVLYVLNSSKFIINLRNSITLEVHPDRILPHPLTTHCSCQLVAYRNSNRETESLQGDSFSHPKRLGATFPSWYLHNRRWRSRHRSLILSKSSSLIHAARYSPSKMYTLSGYTLTSSREKYCIDQTLCSLTLQANLPMAVLEQNSTWRYK